MSSIKPSAHLAEVRYEIRGALTRRAREMEAAGQPIIKLNIGNPGRYGFTTPPHLREAIGAHLVDSEAYGHEQGLEEAREAIVAQQRSRGATGVDVEHVFIGNGVSELIDISLRALLQPGDEVLLPSPDYPLWSAATILNDGSPRYYRCLAENGHLPDPDEIDALVGPRTRALVLINPNNPHRRGLSEGAAGTHRRGRPSARPAPAVRRNLRRDPLRRHTVPTLAAVAGDHPCVSFGGLSKVHRACGYRVGWMSLSGDPRPHRGLSRRPAVARRAAPVRERDGTVGRTPGPARQADHRRTDRTGRPPSRGPPHRARKRRRQPVPRDGGTGRRDLRLPQIRADAIAHFDDTAFALRLLEDENVLLVPGTSFNLSASRHLRLTLLPPPEQLAEVFVRMDRVLARMADEAIPAASAVA